MLGVSLTQRSRGNAAFKKVEKDMCASNVMISVSNTRGGGRGQRGSASEDARRPKEKWVWKLEKILGAQVPGESLSHAYAESANSL